MEAKLKKDWYNREKSIEEIHDDTKHWLSEIEFVYHEMQFLNHLISTNYINCLEAGLDKRIEIFEKKINDEKKIGETLQELLNNHQQTLFDLIETNSVTSNINYIDTHKKLEKEVYAFFAKYKRLKKQIFDTVESIIKKKSQKKLL